MDSSPTRVSSSVNCSTHVAAVPGEVVPVHENFFVASSHVPVAELFSPVELNHHDRYTFCSASNVKRCNDSLSSIDDFTLYCIYRPLSAQRASPVSVPFFVSAPVYSTSLTHFPANRARTFPSA